MPRIVSVVTMNLTGMMVSLPYVMRRGPCRESEGQRPPIWTRVRRWNRSRYPHAVSPEFCDRYPLPLPLQGLTFQLTRLVPFRTGVFHFSRVFGHALVAVHVEIRNFPVSFSHFRFTQYLSAAAASLGAGRFNRKAFLCHSFLRYPSLNRSSISSLASTLSSLNTCRIVLPPA